MRHSASYVFILALGYFLKRVGVFGDEIGLPTRSAVGMNVLPGNIAVEIEALVSYK